MPRDPQTERIYLDHAATTPPAAEVIADVLEVMRSGWGNPSSIHRTGQLAHRRVEESREAVASLIGGGPTRITFTSGGTEAANMAVWSMLAAAPSTRRVIVTSAVEHAAVRAPLDKLDGTDWEIVLLEHDSAGRVIPEALRALIAARGDEIAMLTVMWANNETGVIQPIEALAAMCSDHGIAVHTDATQWVGKMPTNVNSIPIDYLTFAGHKFHGPKGVGVLWSRANRSIEPAVIGGGQERGRRGGTENVPAIVGMGTACSLAADWISGGGPERMAERQIEFERKLLTAVPNACLNGAAAERTWPITNVGFPNVEAELLLLALSERGVDVSAGSACSSGALKASSVLDAMGPQPGQRSGVPYGSVRFSWCRNTTSTLLTRACEITTDVVERLLDLQPGDDQSIPSTHT